MNTPSLTTPTQPSRSAGVTAVVASIISLILTGLLVLMTVTNYSINPENVNVFIALILAAVLSAAYLFAFASFITGIAFAIISLVRNRAAFLLPVTALMLSLGTVIVVVLAIA